MAKKKQANKIESQIELMSWLEKNVPECRCDYSTENQSYTANLGVRAFLDPNIKKVKVMPDRYANLFLIEYN